MLLRPGERLEDRLHQEGVHPMLAFYVRSVEPIYILPTPDGLATIRLTIEEEQELSTQDFLLKPYFILQPRRPRESDTVVDLRGVTYLALIQGIEPAPDSG